jgi:hypothetical protein
VPCGWKNRAISALPVVNIVPAARVQISRRKIRKRRERPDPKQQSMIHFGTDRA